MSSCDLSSLQVRIISFGPATKLKAEAKRLLPGADVAVAPAVDVRASSTDSLLTTGLITHASAHALWHGRKWHHELSSRGAVGVAHAVRLALEEDPGRPLLILEDDCIFHDRERLRADVCQLLKHLADFDMAAFGAHLFHSGRGRAIPYLSRGFYEVHDKFMLLHCVVYSPSARVHLAQRLREPLDMQIDSFYGSLARIGQLRVLAQLHDHSASQSVHASSIQEYTSSCVLCHVQPRPYLLVAMVVLVTLCMVGTIALR